MRPTSMAKILPDTDLNDNQYNSQLLYNGQTYNNAHIYQNYGTMSNTRNECDYINNFPRHYHQYEQLN